MSLHRRGIRCSSDSGASKDLMGADCRECLAGRPHCHGTLIRHPGQHWQCTETDCNHPEVLMHSLSIECEAIGCECGARDDRVTAV